MHHIIFRVQPNPFFLAVGLCLLAAFSSPLQAQKTTLFTQQVSVLTENDRYVFKGKDGYYTNGLLLCYTKVLPQAENRGKRLHHVSLGQKIFMPHSRRIYVPAEIDRPVSGYLFLQYKRSLFKTPQTLWQWGVSADAIGEASGARQVQNTFHNWIDINSSLWGWVWDYQVKSQLGLNMHGQFAKGLITGTTATKIQFIPVTKATLGTSFTNISQGFAIQFGQLATQDQSGFWDAAPGNAPAQKWEWAFYYLPEVMYQAYNATIQGGLFRDNKGPITANPEPFVLTHQAGFFLSGGRYQARLAANFQGKEAKSQRFSHSYGSVQVAYRFR